MTTTDPAPTTTHGIDDAVYRRRWWTLAVLCLSLLIVFVGNSSLNVAIPTLSRELNATESQLQWVIAVYSLVFAGLLFTTGAIGDRFGRKGALQLGLLVFLVACVAAMLSDSMGQLIAARAGMGLGAALIMPSTLSILVNVFPPHERTKAIAIWASVTGAAGAIGPVASGLVLDHYWYGAVFLINLPFVTTALIAGFFLVPKSRDPEHGVLDPPGAVLSIIGLASLIYGLIEAPDRGWTAPGTLAAFALSATAHRAVRVVGAAGRGADARHPLLPQPGVRQQHRRHDARVHGHVRVDVPHDPVHPDHPRLQPSGHVAPTAADGPDHDHRGPAHPATQRPLRGQPHRVGRHGAHRLRLHDPAHPDRRLVGRRGACWPSSR